MKQKAWIARDREDECVHLRPALFFSKPYLLDDYWITSGDPEDDGIDLPHNSFPEIKPGECREVWITDEVNNQEDAFDKGYIKDRTEGFKMKTLIEVWNEKIIIANKRMMIHFYFVYEGKKYYVEWIKGKWSDPRKIEEI
uniref:Uncharacterized protein n=1 Tax=viral metagenome TaxID=1070528 RepID=A0A6M3J787_9ZZZZ